MAFAGYVTETTETAVALPIAEIQMGKWNLCAETNEIFRESQKRFWCIFSSRAKVQHK